ncbi:hypothetical protein [Ancylobacter polymorphus]|uniref:Four helix bundle protein n=1 Tax=Ancylobacter polymorphus TaxID=223390 RepID=A0ABU0B6F2_9HYPH|nr:hypothetical protein [Ancylobacter polymorphus]MDQ0301400.1 hypothetical protein [Ancylobacter polymorphus]
MTSIDGEVLNAAEGLRDLAETALIYAGHFAIPENFAYAILRTARSIGPLISATTTGDQPPADLIAKHAEALVVQLDLLLGHMAERGKLSPTALADAKKTLRIAVDRLSEAIELGRAQ